MIVLLGIVVFCAAFALDYASVQYVQSVDKSDPRPHRAACWSVVMYLVSSFGLLSVVMVSLWLMVPECAGLFFGSLVAARRR